MTVSQAFSTSASIQRIGILAHRLQISRIAQMVAAPRLPHHPCHQDAIFHLHLQLLHLAFR